MITPPMLAAQLTDALRVVVGVVAEIAALPGADAEAVFAIVDADPEVAALLQRSETLSDLLPSQASA